MGIINKISTLEYYLYIILGIITICLVILTYLLLETIFNNFKIMNHNFKEIDGKIKKSRLQLYLVERDIEIMKEKLKFP